MKYQTHHAGGLVAAELSLLYFQQPVWSWITPAAIIGGYFWGVIADVDKPESYIGEKLLPLSLAMQSVRIRHRTLTHSVLITAGLWFFLVAAGLPSVLAAAWVSAYASHWFLDMFNEQGVELFWPIPIRIKFLPAWLSIDLDSLAESWLRQGLYMVHYLLLFVLVKPVLFGVPIIGPLFSGMWGWLLRLLPPFIANYL